MEQELNGIFVVDKPENTTSAKVVAVLKKLLKAKKVGHAGTLDPFATGVLICCVNQATRLARFFLTVKKKYDAVLRLGIETDTQDHTGKIVSTSNSTEFSKKEIRAAVKNFVGRIEQFPPVYSALKHKGVPLYKFARAGKPIQKPARSIHISAIRVVDVRLPDIRMEISCSAGTYIRTLCADIGRVLGCGGHLTRLRRTECGRFSAADALTLPDIENLAASGKLSLHLIEMAEALKDMPAVTAEAGLIEKIRKGIILSRKDLNPGKDLTVEGYIKVVDQNQNLISVLDVNPGHERFKYCCVFS